jgi:hypothetical protein
MELENFFTSVEPFLVFAKFLGFFPMSFDGPARNGKFKVKFFNIFATSCFTLISALILFLNITNGAFVTTDSRLLYYGWVLPSISEMFFQLGLFIKQVNQRADVVNFLKQLNSVDEKVLTFVLFC